MLYYPVVLIAELDPVIQKLTSSCELSLNNLLSISTVHPSANFSHFSEKKLSVDDSLSFLLTFHILSS